ncbi:5'-methylthioadenosine/adenosylhomocysteine nucleosidase [Gilliamella sp. B2776]|uniref:5'-methylthioadenosine/adenosylhomocysteine nucleosidase n=1 Tax=unclassified Gilliamella TaxID=2685620 RepID=UPI00226AEC81|nr:MULTISPECIES: 5'-methylthioadenosine/adenosylhomocysteine nucleosidase [unclassified Gilliamella]MCX8650838.1 5'-methylthioadenosine/adenosylhomocysteine nucleosidase [Gilliamella sp. B2779]MCX8653982.1 5'-methylthioadenosine/adenosylhomocysteine nucleosidase [Gilliamella sp. B2737]MCX8657254.1 5'-methylthioadenosine/adenosylhomocysteine nucleosidase [Gilliamella sp. B2894]MCX8665906.1 5'-methylthioadenosine/adenosylhomocysteine nucleosidase [Gilliamella sp. B2887]MCX8691465.1 5'-methylthio
MKIAIIAAMEEEVTILKSKITHYHVERHLGCDFHLGKIANCEIVLLQSGIGKVAAASGTTLLLNNYQVDAVINTGSAGGLSSELNIGDIIVSRDVFYHDVDLTAFSYKPGQMSGCPVTFKADPKYQLLAKTCIQKQGVNAVEGSIGSGDAFINGKSNLERIKQTFPDAIAVEMEAAAIGHVCWLFKIPFVVVRAISDNGDSESAVDFQSFLKLAATQSSLIVESMLSELA